MQFRANGCAVMLMNVTYCAKFLNERDIFKIGVNDRLIVYFQVMNSKRCIV